jgi:CHASE2 domain-containing sensor protein/signal transduction histidine kinase
MLELAPVAEDSPPLILDERKFYREWWLTSLLALSVLVLMTSLQWGQSPGQVIYDQFHHWLTPQADPQVVVVAIDDQSLDALGGWPLQRGVYAELLRQLAPPAHKPQGVAFDILFLDPSPADAELARQMSQHRVVLATEQGRQRGNLNQRRPVAALSQAASSLAHINASFESDGTLRGAHLMQDTWPNLALALSGQSTERYSSYGSYRRFLQVDPQTGFATVSLSDVLSGQFALSLFKDKYVLIGATSPSLGDQFPGVHAGRQNAGTPGVVLHASLLSALLQGRLIEPVPLWQQQTFSALALAMVLLALLVLSPMAELAVSVAVMLGAFVFSFVLLMQSQRWFDPGLLLMVIVFLKPTWAWRRSEMVVHFLRQGVRSLGQDPRPLLMPRPVKHSRWFPRSDTIQRSARLLHNAIGQTQVQLQFFNRLVAEIPSALLVADAQGRITLVNPRMDEGLPSGLLQVGEPLLPLMYYLGLSKTLQLQKLTGKDQYVSAIDTQGMLRHYIFHLAQVQSDTAQPWWILVLTDITEMRQLQLSREKTLQLLSHDMRTPVASIIALTRQTRQQDAALKIGHHANTLLQMMDDFIFSIKAQAPQYALVESLMDSLVDDAIFQVKDLAQGRHMRVVVQFDDDPQFIRADQRLLTRMLVNLLVNAVRYGQAHSNIELRLSHLHNAGVGEGGWLHLTLRNTVGQPDNPEEDQNVAMNSFGLGLEFVKTVVRKHAGHIQIDLPAEPGAMAQVHLQLPLVDLR